MGRGKHFIGDFLPPDELEKFMETFKALKVNGESPGISPAYGPVQQAASSHTGGTRPSATGDICSWQMSIWGIHK